MRKSEDPGIHGRAWLAAEHWRKTEVLFVLANAELTPDKVTDFEYEFVRTLFVALGRDDLVWPATAAELEALPLESFESMAAPRGVSASECREQVLAEERPTDAQKEHRVLSYVALQGWLRQILTQVVNGAIDETAAELQDLLEGMRWATPRLRRSDGKVEFRMVPAFDEKDTVLLAYVTAKELLEAGVEVRVCPHCERFFPILNRKTKIYCSVDCQVRANNERKISSGYMRTFVKRKRHQGHASYL